MITLCVKYRCEGESPTKAQVDCMFKALDDNAACKDLKEQVAERYYWQVSDIHGAMFSVYRDYDV